MYKAFSEAIAFISVELVLSFIFKKGKNNSLHKHGKMLKKYKIMNKKGKKITYYPIFTFDT